MKLRMEAFDACGPLPTGTTLLEASAGTGKTWTIGALVTRYVAEGRARLEQMLVVTFGRAASQELRERVRAQLVEAEHAFTSPDDRPESDLLDLLLDVDESERGRRHGRIREALAGFDGATIATTHQFCSLVLDSLGVAGDSDAQAELVEDLRDVLTEVVDDLYVRGFARAERPAFSRDEAMQIALAATGRNRARLEPVDAERDTPAGIRVRFGVAVREEMERRKRRLGVLSYDDLLSQLADALADDEAPARSRMRDRWQIVLVDEFQDTDPVQWQVLDRAFTGHATMVLIGDPKQAIYAFRGGDVATYLQAEETATTRMTLGTNWRSDSELLDSVQVLLEGAELGDERIVVHPVRARHQGHRLKGAPQQAPFRLRVARRDQFGKAGKQNVGVGDLRPYVARDLALDVRTLLASGATYDGEPLAARDIAVIAYKHDDLAASRDALREVGIAAVIAGGGSVFETPAAVELLSLLEALEQPHRAPRVRAAALTSFFGHTATSLDRGGDQLTDRVADTIREWAEVFPRRGVAAVLEAATAGGLPARVLTQVGGERQMTDLRHVAEALHEVGSRDRLGVVGVLTWLRGQVADARAGRGNERTRRLDSDAAAVQLVTIHASKGLEYPVVYLPALFDRKVWDPKTPMFHDDAGERCIDIGGESGPAFAKHKARALQEDAGEWLRLLYVAITRAKSQVVAWWAPTSNTPESPLSRVMFDRTPGSAAVARKVPNPTDDVAAAHFAEWAAVGGPQPEPSVHVESTEAPMFPPLPTLGRRTFTRTVDVAWQRSSYSSLTRVEIAAPLSGVSSESDVVTKDDEPEIEVAVDGAAAVEPVVESGDVLSPMADLPGGRTFGSLVHAVLEHADPEAVDLAAELCAHLDEQLVQWPVDLDREALVEALVAVCDSPLGPLVGTTLRGIPVRDRLREMAFELPLAGGDGDVTADVRLRDLAPVLRRLPEDDPVRAYADALDLPALGGQTLRGYLAGFIDLVFRVPGPEGPRYFIVDYKTNWLGGHEQPLTATSFAPAELARAMNHSDYPLQALLYAVVLHRFLRWRQPGYRPEQHLGGVLYLYLRGMCGPGTPTVDGQPCGVFSWRPPVWLVDEVSDLLDGKVRA